MTTLADLETKLARALRDEAHSTWSTTELDDLINAGIFAVSDVAPREIVQTIGTVSAGVYSYAASSFSFAYRVDIYTPSGSYSHTIPHSTDGPDDGWEFHGNVVYLPPGWLPDAGSTIRLWGYGAYTQLAASSSTTDLTARAMAAALLYAQIEGYGRLIADRAAFGQWQAEPGNTDTTLLSLNQTYFSLRRRWQEEQRSIRRMRKG